MNTPTVNYRYAHNFLQRINALIINGTVLMNHCQFGGYNMWHTQQQRLFQDILEFSKQQNTPTTKPVVRIVIQEKIISLALVVATILGALSLFVRRPMVLIYAVDQYTPPFKSDFRMRSAYEAVMRNHGSYGEVFHTKHSIRFLKNMFMRGRLALYIEGVRSMAALVAPKNAIDVSAIDFSSFTNMHERAFAQMLVKRYMAECALVPIMSRIFQFILAHARTRVVLSLDDMRYYHPLIHAAHQLGITSYAMQHGHFTRYHVGWLAPLQTGEGRFVTPTKFLVWNNYWQTELLRLNTYIPKATLMVGGFPEHIPSPIEAIDDGVVGVLVPYETVAPKASVRAYIEKIIEHPKALVFFKIRPDISKELQLSEYGIDENNPRIKIIAAIAEVETQIDVVAGVYSTFLYDMVTREVPAIMFTTEMDYGQGMIDNDMADPVTLETIGEKITEIEKNTNGHLHTRTIARTQKLVGENKKLLSETLSELLKDGMG